MKRFLLFCLRLALALRYRIHVKGLEKIESKQGGILFLANHPAEVDPVILIALLYRRFRIHPVAADFIFHLPVIRWFVSQVGTIPIPGFDLSSNSFKKMRIEKTYEEVSGLLHRGENVLVYPAGILKTQEREEIGAASGVHELLQRNPDLTIVLVRTEGLWGSSFSKALTGQRPEMLSTFLNGIKTILKNLIFFVPKRELKVTFEVPGESFPRKAKKLEINHYLEEWFNPKEGDPLKLVPYRFWSKRVPEVVQRPEQTVCSLDQIPGEVQSRVKEEISLLIRKPVEEIVPELDLARDLAMDSLDKSQLAIVLKEHFSVTELNSAELITVLDVMAYAAHLRKSEMTEEHAKIEKSIWGEELERPDPLYPNCAHLLEGFLMTATRLDRHLAAADLLSGEVTYRRLKLAVILLALHLRDLPGERIGIMLPASIAVDIAILACQLAGKVPVMINWTLGPRNLESIVEQTGIEVTLSSWRFLDRLNDVDLGLLDQQIILLEELRATFTPKQTIRAMTLSRKSPKAILNRFGLQKLGPESLAVILFTSGTESFPKGVPLTHGNLMANQRAAERVVSIQASDVLLGVLPPFHSFGFSVTGLLPLVGGVRVVYSPNPTNGRQIAYAIERWKATLFCSAPTFLKSLLRVATKDQLASLRIVISGAESLPCSIESRLKELNPKTLLIEGYGITECSPILTLCPPGKPHAGVGQPLPGVEIKIIHPESREEMPIGQSGVIIARGANIFGGYLEKKPWPFVELEGKSWYETGDLGFLDKGNNLTIQGRLKRFVKIGGEMVSLGMIEEELRLEGQKRGWELANDAPSFAVIAKEEGEQKSSIHLFTTCSLDVNVVNAVLRERGMSNLIKVQSVEKLLAIPLLGTGKIDYRSLTKRLKSKD